MSGTPRGYRVPSWRLLIWHNKFPAAPLVPSKSSSYRHSTSDFLDMSSTKTILEQLESVTRIKTHPLVLVSQDTTMIQGCSVAQRAPTLVQGQRSDEGQQNHGR